METKTSSAMFFVLCALRSALCSMLHATGSYFSEIRDRERSDHSSTLTVRNTRTYVRTEQTVKSAQGRTKANAFVRFSIKLLSSQTPHIEGVSA